MNCADDSGSAKAQVASPTDTSTVNAPAVARKAPYYVELARDQVVLWCRCGLSRKQPYCDGSHAATDILPMRYAAGADAEEVLFCGCKRTATPPFCDGAHNALLAAYESDDPESAANRAVRQVAVGRRRQGASRWRLLRLHGRPAVLARSATASAWAAPVSAGDGARHQALFCVDVQPDAWPVLDFGHAPGGPALHAGEDATLAIGRQSFDGRRGPGVEVGVCVLPGEAFRVANVGDAASASSPRSGRSTTELPPSRVPRRGMPRLAGIAPEATAITPAASHRSIRAASRRWPIASSRCSSARTTARPA